MDQFIQDILMELTGFEVWGITTLYFTVLYFGLAPVFNGVCRLLERKGWLNRIDDAQVKPDQVRMEIKNSAVSVFIFGLSGLPVFWMLKYGWIQLLPHSVGSVLLGVVLLSLWNEVHFFLVHRLMHLPWFMRNVHVIHHRSRIPTVYSVYSFHWIEAFLLSTVPLFIIPVLPFAPLGIFLYPLASILMNYAGHCNYRFGSGKGSIWTRFGSRHSNHHTAFDQSYGFVSHLPDKLYRWLSTKLKI